MNAMELHGKRHIGAIIVILLLISLGMAAGSRYFSGIVQGPVSWLRIGSTLVLYVFLYRGNGIARRITVLLTILSAFICLYAALMSPTFNSTSLLLLALALIYGGISFHLLRSERVAAYFDYCRYRARENRLLRQL